MGVFFNMASTTDEDVSSSHKGKKFARLLSRLNLEQYLKLMLRYLVIVQQQENTMLMNVVYENGVQRRNPFQVLI